MTAWHQDDGSGAIPSPSTKELRRKPRRNCRKQVKDRRRLATRFEKLAENFLAMVKLAMLERLLKALLPDTA